MAQASSCNAMALSFSSSSFGFATADIRRTSCSVGDAAVVKGVSMQHHSLGNAGMAVGAKGSSLIRPASLRGTPLRSGDASKCRWLSQPGTAHVVRASDIGVVKDVKLAAQKMYYNVTLTVLPDSEVAKWYRSPGQYVELIPANAEPGRRATEFFIASPVRRQCTELEFLIQDVPNTVANDIINSKPGERVLITTDDNSTGFDRDSIPYSESVLLFASGYGIGPMRALIETGFEANERKDAILFAMYTPEQEPYKDRHQAWEQTGIKIQSGTPKIPATNAAKTLVYMVASTVEQKKLAAYFEARGVPEDNIYTLFDGIPVASDAYYNKVLHKLNYYPKFPTHSPEHVAVELKI